VAAATPQDAGARAYLYGSLGDAIPVPLPYESVGLIEFPRLACGPLEYPQDLFVDARGDLYIADTGHGRILKLSPRGDVLLEISHARMTSPVGLFVDDGGGIWAADSTTNTVFAFDGSGNLAREYPPPRSDVLPEGYIYSPTRVLVDRRGWLLVIGTGSSGGIIQIDPDGGFQGFFGANPAATNIVRRIVRAVASEEQKRSQLLQSLQPYTDFELAVDGTVVTVTETLPTKQIRRINALGVSTFPDGRYGETAPVDGIVVAPRLAFVTSDVDGILTVMDRTSRRLFQYGRDGDLLFAWAGAGAQRGTFQGAGSIAMDRATGTLYVLDGVANTVQALRPTAFARLVHQGAALYAEGRYEEALETWLEVRRRDASYPLANRGIGKVLVRMGTRLGRLDYLAAAMDRYREAGDRARFSEAFAAHRRLWIQRSLPAILFAIVVAFAAVWTMATLARRARRSPSEARRRQPSPYRIWRVLGHPYQVMQDVKWEYGPATKGAAVLSLGLFAAARLVQLAGTGFHYSRVDPGYVNLVSEMVRLLLPWFTWIAANYLVTAIFRGEGTVGRIFSASAFALVPLTVGMLTATGLSHVLSLEESSVYQAVQLILYTWSGLLFLIGVSTVHDYGLRGTLGTTLLSIAGIVVLWGVAFLVIGLVSTAAGFVIDVIREVVNRG
jgi:hypothetical protein